MVLKGILKQGEYFDSVSLMIVARQFSEMEAVLDAAVVMGTSENKAILKNSGMLLPEFETAGDTDLLIGIKARDESGIEQAFRQVDALLATVRRHIEDTEDFLPKSLEGALKIMPDTNIALISVPGKYAAKEAMKALEHGLHVMIFSDNVPLEKEVELKQYAREHGLLVMGPDCGTAIINGVPLAFANVVKRGNIGIVAASGTGLQEVSCVISRQGAGISQAIGTGGRDVSQQVGGVMFLEGLKALKDDPQTQVITLVSKPPHQDVFQKIAADLKTINKPVVACLIGEDSQLLQAAGAISARTLEEAGMLAAALSQGKEPNEVSTFLEQRSQELKMLAAQEAEKRRESQKYLSGLFSGGTLCDEAQLILRPILSKVYSNTPISPECELEDSWKNREHTVIDFGDDEFTVGRPHPMIDYSLRNGRILEEAQDPEVAVLLLDVVLGYGAHPHPEEELAPFIREAKTTAEEAGRYLSVVCSVTGTDEDPQDKMRVEQALRSAGALVMPSNAAACELAGYIC
ncbi:MAG: acyl-CoA synthetase FdrA [Candidatus Vecturithrix sp.]|jgi:succinyl-CoA synthetase alpha subunit|nr:acyl-CoA synthetase FdrA [Candidatus Vecturithrix sp.]